MMLAFLFLGCFIERFHFVCCKIWITSSKQECLGKGTLIVIAVPSWWAVIAAKVCGKISVG